MNNQTGQMIEQWFLSSNKGVKHKDYCLHGAIKIAMKRYECIGSESPENIPDISNHLKIISDNRYIVELYKLKPGYFNNGTSTSKAQCQMVWVANFSMKAFTGTALSVFCSVFSVLNTIVFFFLVIANDNFY